MLCSKFVQAEDCEVNWRIASQACGGNLYLHQLKLDFNDSGGTTMEKLREKHRHIKSSSPHGFGDRVLPFWRPIIETAVLSPARILKQPKRS